MSLVMHYRGRRQLDEAGDELERAATLAAASDEASWGQEVRLLRAGLLMDRGDLAGAYRLLRQVEGEVFAQGPARLRLNLLSQLAGVTQRLGRYTEALAYYRRMVAMGEQRGDLRLVANARFNIAALEQEAPPRPGARAEALALAREALTAAVASEQRAVEARAHLLLGELLGGREGRQHLERCLALERETGIPYRISTCLRALAVQALEEDPRRAQGLLGEALDLLAQAEDPWSIAYAGLDLMRVSWATRPPEEAYLDSLLALDAVEALRDRQRAGGGRETLFAAWADDYYFLCGRLFEEAQSSGRPEDLERAFQVTERLRARVLLETLEAVGAAARPALPAPLQARVDALAERRVRLQRRLLDPDLPRGSRSRALEELEQLDIEETAIDDRLPAAGHTTYAAGRAPDLATLSEVRSTLADDEALLSFQLGLWEDLAGRFAGGSWLLLATRDEERLFRLPDRARLGPAVEVFLGLFERRDGSEAVPAASLYRELLAEALAALPPGVERLVIVPDGILHLVPFAALRPAPSAPPLAARYQLAEVPSATLWRHWRAREPAPAETPALVLADPVPAPAPAAGVPEERSWALETGARLGPLPYARREGRALIRRLGGAGRLWIGAEASERVLKVADLRRFAILHFAAHALVDDEHPHRSAVLLAPGAAEEDGLLQVPEIARLDLAGRVVVLSACRGASGAVLRGEGVLGLARAFFEAGANTVVGSLWPLRDDDAAAFFDPFYRHLARGESVAGALAGAQRDRDVAGAPAAAWAGVVALGDGDLVPFPGGLESPARRGWPALVATALLVALVLAALLAATRRVRRRRNRSEKPDLLR